MLGRHNDRTMIMNNKLSQARDVIYFKNGFPRQIFKHLLMLGITVMIMQYL